MIIFWALRQWIGSRRLAQTYADYGWTQVHGFFAQMGGFVLVGHVHGPRNSHTRIVEISVLPPDRLAELHRDKRIAIPLISAKQISDRSKGDAFSKCLVVLQTMWFVVQCIARRISGLYIAPLEIATLAFAALNGIMYFLWWHKPLDPRTPIEIQNQDFALQSPGDEADKDVDHQYTLTEPMSQGIPLYFNGSEIMRNNDNRPMSPPASLYPPSTFVSGLGNNRTRGIREVDISQESSLRRIMFFIYRRLREMRNPVTYATDSSDTYNNHRIPTFYALNPDVDAELREDLFVGHVLIICIGVVFGGIHVLGWFKSSFPTNPEMILWRICTVVILALPVLYGAPILFVRAVVPKEGLTTSIRGVTMIIKVIKAVQAVVPPLYILARLVLIIEAIFALRNVPSTGFETVEWTKYVPHI